MAPRRSSSKARDSKVDEIASRLQRHANEKWPEHGQVEVRRRGGFVYILLSSGGENPEPLCRLRQLPAQDLWEFSYYSHASDKYEPSVLPSGEACGTLEECFDCASLTYVGEEPDDDFAQFLRMRRAERDSAQDASPSGSP